MPKHAIGMNMKRWLRTGARVHWTGTSTRNTTSGCCCPRIPIACGDTLLNPRHWDDQPFDAIVSNPPYSVKWVGDNDSTLINDPRFAPAGALAPKGYADLAFTMHMLSWLSTDGTATIVDDLESSGDMMES